jgi:hypothetical protein
MEYLQPKYTLMQLRPRAYRRGVARGHLQQEGIRTGDTQIRLIDYHVFILYCSLGNVKILTLTNSGSYPTLLQYSTGMACTNVKY